ncbi:MAG: class I SAM-dependent methyltransferase [Thermoplasmata archaeon]|jgi:predicted O-methyltransferase YrrM|nr:class I SAM-dependent methyltransferase [Thermoplasmata archaeon]
MATFADRLGGFPRWVTEAYWTETHGSVFTAPAHPAAFRRAVATARSLIPRVAQLTGASPTDVRKWLGELRGARLAQEIRARCPEASGMGSPNAELLYVFVRAVRPRVIVETGVELGVSSAYFLQGLRDNNSGELWSIDLPTIGPSGRLNQEGRLDRSHVGSVDQVGKAIPERLRPRWHLSLGDARELLPSLDAPSPWDIFFHDSDHSRSHMLWEYQTAWPRLRPEGYLLSDDVPDNDAFLTFASSVSGRPFLWLRRGALRKARVAPAAA